jgi:hypothetical protein
MAGQSSPIQVEDVTQPSQATRQESIITTFFERVWIILVGLALTEFAKAFTDSMKYWEAWCVFGFFLMIFWRFFYGNWYYFHKNIFLLYSVSSIILVMNVTVMIYHFRQQLQKIPVPLSVFDALDPIFFYAFSCVLLIDSIAMYISHLCTQKWRAAEMLWMCNNVTWAMLISAITYEPFLGERYIQPVFEYLFTYFPRWEIICLAMGYLDSFISMLGSKESRTFYFRPTQLDE